MLMNFLVHYFVDGLSARYISLGWSDPSALIAYYLERIISQINTCAPAGLKKSSLSGDLRLEEMNLQKKCFWMEKLLKKSVLA